MSSASPAAVRLTLSTTSTNTCMAVNLSIRDYIGAYEELATEAKNSATVIDAMTSRYPDFTNVGDLEIGAKVFTGEMDW